MKALLLNINWSKVMCLVGGGLWTWVEPTVPFALLSIFAVLIDCLSAWRLNRRIRRKYGPKAADGKLKSQHMGKMITDLLMVFFVMLLCEGIDRWVLTDFTVPLSNMVACVFLLKTIVSILENESSCSGKTWAKIMQKYVVDKTKRHLEIDLEELEKENQNEDKDA